MLDSGALREARAGDRRHHRLDRSDPVRRPGPPWPRSVVLGTAASLPWGLPERYDCTEGRLRARTVGDVAASVAGGSRRGSFPMPAWCAASPRGPAREHGGSVVDHGHDTPAVSKIRHFHESARRDRHRGPRPAGRRSRPLPVVPDGFVLHGRRDRVHRRRYHRDVGPPHDGCWSAPVILEPRSASASAQLDAVSCPSASSSTAVDAGGRALEYVGGRWLPPIAVDPGGDLSAVSCLATDSLGHEITRDGKGWSLPATVDQVGSSAQSCASAVLRGDRRTGRCRPAGAGPMVTRTPAHTRAVTSAHTRAGDRDLARRATALLPTACPRFFRTSYPVRRTPPRSHRGAARPADA